MHASIRRAVEALTLGADEQRHFDLAAAHIQRALLEFQTPHLAGVEVGIHVEPARLVGGDYLDVTISEEHLVFGLGDASGKSLAAALHALSLRYLVRGLLRSVGVHDLATVVAHANAVVTADMQEDHFVTFLLGTYHPPTHTMRIVNAGHEPPLVLRRGAAEPDLISPHGIVLGIDPAHRFPIAELDLGPGDAVVIYTDGLTEATNERGEAFTIESVSRFFAAHRSDAPQVLADGLFDEVKRFAQAELRDDATVFVMKIDE